MYRNHRVAVVLPAHNEERLIGLTLRSLPAFVDWIFAVDDASDDMTADAISCEAETEPRIVLLRRDSNGGVGAAIVTGYRAALAAGADIVVVMDGDGQMHPDDLPTLLAPLAELRADIAKGNRFDRFRARGPMPRTRLIGNHVLSSLTKVVAGVRGPLDAQCGYVAVSAAALSRLPLDTLYPRYGFPNDLLIRALEARLRVVSVPIRAVYGQEVSGIRPLVAIPRILGLLAKAAVRRARSVDPETRRELAAGATQRP